MMKRMSSKIFDFVDCGAEMSGVCKLLTSRSI